MPPACRQSFCGRLCALIAGLLIVLAAPHCCSAEERQCAERGLALDHPAVVPWGGREPKFRSAWGQKCIGYRKVCFDQQTIVSFDPAHSPGNLSAVPIPQLNIAALTYVWSGQQGVNGDVSNYASQLYAPLAYRPASALEASPDLRQPHFSNCSVPLVMWGLWSAHNLFEFFVRMPARLWTLQQAGALSNHTTLVVGSPAGERLPQFAPTMLQPFTPYEVVSFAEFSQRNTPANGPRTTAEGAGQRCFERAYLCAWQVGHVAGTWGAAEAVVAHYRAKGLPVNPLGFDGEAQVLKVLIESRQGPVRNILNARQLVDECNRLSASWPLDPASPIKRIQCRFTSFGADPVQDMLATASADVLVAVHGAGCTNWLFMAPGSALLEVRPYLFGSHGWADGYFPSTSVSSNLTRFFYGLNIESSKAWKPGAAEVARGLVNRTMDPRLLRDRHVILPLDALKDKLLRIAAAGRSRERYIAQQAQQLHYSELREDGRLHIRCIPNRRPPTGPCSQAAMDAARQAASSGQPQQPAVVAQAPAAAPVGVDAMAAADAPAEGVSMPLEDMPLAGGSAAPSPAAAPAGQPSPQPAVSQLPVQEQKATQHQQPPSQQQQQPQQQSSARQQQSTLPERAAEESVEPADEAAQLGSTPAQPAAAAAAAAAHLPAEAAPAGLWNGRTFRYGPPGVAALSAIALLAAAATVYITLRRRKGTVPPPASGNDDDADAESKPLTAVSVQLPALSRSPART